MGRGFNGKPWHSTLENLGIPLQNVPICRHHPSPSSTALSSQHLFFFLSYHNNAHLPSFLFLLRLSQTLTILFSIYFAQKSCQNLQLPHISSESPPLTHPAHEGKHRRKDGQKQRQALAKAPTTFPPSHFLHFLPIVPQLEHGQPTVSLVLTTNIEGLTALRTPVPNS